MAYDLGYNAVRDILQRRTDELADGKQRTWALATGTSLQESIDNTFDRISENEEWKADYEANAGSGADMDPNRAIFHAERIAFLCACNRDLRTQYASGKDCVARTPAHQLMTRHSQAQRALAALKHFDSKITEHKNKITEA